jgi:GT2 family glycosyltransferase
LKKNETLAIVWIDNGLVEGQFTLSLGNYLLYANKNNIKINSLIRVNGNQIARQRELALSLTLESKTDWSLWIDSDIMFKPEDVDMLMNVANKENRKVISGLYYVSYDGDGSFRNTVPAMYTYNNSDGLHYPILDFQEENIFKVDAVGFGFILIHNSVFSELKQKHSWIFNDHFYDNGFFISEDISFCQKLRENNIPIFLHPKAKVNHIKKVMFNESYVNLNKNYNNALRDS